MILVTLKIFAWLFIVTIGTYMLATLIKEMIKELRNK